MDRSDFALFVVAGSISFATGASAARTLSVGRGFETVVGVLTSFLVLAIAFRWNEKRKERSSG